MLVISQPTRKGSRVRLRRASADVAVGCLSPQTGYTLAGLQTWLESFLQLWYYRCVRNLGGGKASRFRFAAQVGRTKNKKVTDKSREAMSEMEERRKYCIFN